MTRYTFLGPSGTFTESALAQVIALDDPAHQVSPAASVQAALDAVSEGEVDAAMVPIENSVEGGVSVTLDAIAAGHNLRIVREVLVPISFVLAVPDSPQAPIELADISTVSTHTHAWAQVRQWAQEYLPDAEYLPASSTAAAATALTQPGCPAHQAAVCSAHVAHRLGLKVLAQAIEDNPGAVTRFVLVTGQGQLPPVTGADKTTLVIPLPEEDRPGALLEILEFFKLCQVNLSRIESRPTGAGLGSYFFSIDVEGHIGEARVQDALEGVYRFSPHTKFLGSYPRADQHRPVISALVDEAAYERARQRVNRLLDGS